MKYHRLIGLIVVTSCLLILHPGCSNPTKSGTETPKTTNQDTSKQAIKTIEKDKTITKKTEPNGPAPKIVFEKTVLDFGKLVPNQQATGQFVFKNEGKGDLVISKVSECCGVSPIWEERKYKPGESGIIKIDFKGTSQTGLFTRNPIVESNDPCSPKFSLTVKADVSEIIVLEPDRIKLFLNEENASCPRITLKGTDNQLFSINRYKSTGGAFTIDIDPSIKAKEFILQPKVNIEKLQSNTSGNIVFDINHPIGTMAATVLYDVLPDFSLSPSLVIKFFEMKALKPVTQPITVKSNLGKEFEIESVSSKENIVKLTSKTSTGKNSYRLDVEITPPEPSEDVKKAGGQISLEDRLYIKIKDGPVLEAKCNLYYNN
jgi:hypothetical protein